MADTRPERRFTRIDRLPPYVFNITAELKMAARRRGEDIIDFSMGNPDGATPPHIVEKLCTVAQRPDTHGYSTSRGIPRLRRAISRWYQDRYGVEIDPESEAIVTIGSKEGLAHLMLATLVFLAVDGHLIMLRMVILSFETLPVSDSGLSLPSIRTLIGFLGVMYQASLVMALSAIVALLLINFAFGVMTRAAPQLTAQQGQQAAVRIGRRTPLAVEHQQARAGPQRAQGGGIATQRIAAIQAGVGECEAFQPGRRPHGHGAAAQTVKLLPQPQVVLALGLRITNCAPPRPSL